MIVMQSVYLYQSIGCFLEVNVMRVKINNYAEKYKKVFRNTRQVQSPTILPIIV